MKIFLFKATLIFVISLTLGCEPEITVLEEAEFYGLGEIEVGGCGILLYVDGRTRYQVYKPIFVPRDIRVAPFSEGVYRVEVEMLNKYSSCDDLEDYFGLEEVERVEIISYKRIR